MKKAQQKNEEIWKTNNFLGKQHNFTLIQKRIVHFIYSQIQTDVYNESNGIKAPRSYQVTAFNDAYFRIPCDNLDKTNNAHRAIRHAIKGLMLPITDDDYIGNFLMGAHRQEKAWVVMIPKKALNYMIEKAEDGVTALETILYLSASSSYTISMYEQLKQRADFVKWYTTPIELADLLCAPQSYYTEFGQLKNRILEPAKKELRALYEKQQSLICFDYTLERGGRGNKVQRIIFTIYEKGKSKKQTPEEQQAKRNADFQAISFIMGKCMLDFVGVPKGMKKKNHEFISRTLDLLSQRNAIEPFAKKLNAARERAERQGEDPDSIGGVIRHILATDFNIE